MTRLELRDVRRSFTVDGTSRVVLPGIALSIDPGELVCLLGPSGCGKTTLLRVIASLDLDYSGSVLVDGNPTRTPGPDRLMLFQEPGQIFPWRRVVANIGLPLQLRRVPEWRTHARRLANLVGLDDAADHYPHQLSSGMKQRVALARALAVEPAVLLMDEPFASLDSATRASLHALFLRVHAERSPTVLFVTHQIDEAILLADRIVVMGTDGSLVHQERIDAPRPRQVDSTRLRSLASLMSGNAGTEHRKD